MALTEGAQTMEHLAMEVLITNTAGILVVICRRNIPFKGYCLFYAFDLSVDEELVWERFFL